MKELFHNISSKEYYNQLMNYAYAGHSEKRVEYAYIHPATFYKHIGFDACNGTNSTCGVDIEILKQLVYINSFDCFFFMSEWIKK